MRRLLAVLVLLPVLAAGGCGQDYCGTVSDEQEDLTRTLGEGGNGALIDALPTFEDLRDRAPEDVAGDWDTVVVAVTALRDALDDAGVDPATYDRDSPPEGVTDAERRAIDEAAAQVGSQATTEAFASVQQQVRDVCHTPLTL